MSRKRFADMTLSELEAYEEGERYQTGRKDAFNHGNPETIIEYWDRDAPNHDELLIIVRNILSRMP